jgi:phage FluMu gp28-like protein
LEARRVARFFVGLDLGQSRDYTAICVAEKVPPEGSNDYELHVRHLERFRDVLYPEVVERVSRLMEALQLKGEAALAVDATGVGAAVVDMLRRVGLTFDAVTITGGDTETQSGHDSYRVPKRDLVGNLQVLLQSGRLKVARSLEHAETLKAELLNFRVKINVATAHESYEAWREGDHDDLVLAAALAAWRAGRKEFILLIGRA